MRLSNRVAISHGVAIAAVIAIIVVSSVAGGAYLASQNNHKRITSTSTIVTQSPGNSGSTPTGNLNFSKTTTGSSSSGSQSCALQLNWTQSLPKVSVGTFPTDVALGFDGNLYVANNEGSSVSLVNSTDLGTIRTLPVGENPFDIAYDSIDEYMFVSNFGSNSISIIDGWTGNVSTTVDVGAGPKGLAFDWNNSETYVANSQSGSVSVIQGSEVNSTIKVGVSPDGVVLDNASGDIYVSSPENITVISGESNRVVGTISDRLIPSAMTFDSLTNEVYVGNNLSNTVTVFNGTDNKIIGNIAVPGPLTTIAADIGDGLIFVGNANSGAITAIQDSTNRVVATIDTGMFGISSLAYDLDTGELYFTDLLSNSIYVLNASAVSYLVSSNHTCSSITQSSSYTSTLPQISITTSSENCSNGTSTSTTLASTSTSYPNETITPGSYVLQEIPENVSIGAIAYDPSIIVNSFYVTPSNLPELDSTSNLVYVANGATYTYNSISIPVQREPVDVIFDPDNNYVYVANYISDSISVINASINSVIANISVGPGPVRMAYNPWNQEIYVSDGLGEEVSVIDASTNAVVTNVTMNGVAPFDLAYDALSHNIFVTSESGGILLEINSSSNELLQHSEWNLTGSPDAAGLVAYDSTNAEVYFTTFGSAEVEAIGSGASGVTIIPLNYAPSAIAYDPADQNVFVAGNASGGFLYLINSSNDVLNYTVGVGFSPLEMIPNTPDLSQFPNATNYAMVMTSADDRIFVLANWANITQSYTSTTTSTSSSRVWNALQLQPGCLGSITATYSVPPGVQEFPLNVQIGRFIVQGNSEGYSACDGEQDCDGVGITSSVPYLNSSPSTENVSVQFTITAQPNATSGEYLFELPDGGCGPILLLILGTSVPGMLPGYDGCLSQIVSAVSLSSYAMTNFPMVTIPYSP